MSLEKFGQTGFFLCYDVVGWLVLYDQASRMWPSASMVGLANNLFDQVKVCALGNGNNGRRSLSFHVSVTSAIFSVVTQSQSLKDQTHEHFLMRAHLSSNSNVTFSINSFFGKAGIDQWTLGLWSSMVGLSK